MRYQIIINAKSVHYERFLTVTVTKNNFRLQLAHVKATWSQFSNESIMF